MMARVSPEDEKALQLTLLATAGDSLAQMPVCQIAWFLSESRYDPLAKEIRETGAGALHKTRHLLASLAIERAEADTSKIFNKVQIVSAAAAIARILALDAARLAGSAPAVVLSWMHRRHNPRFIDNVQIRDRLTHLFGSLPISENGFEVSLVELCAALDRLARRLGEQIQAVFDLFKSRDPSGFEEVVDRIGHATGLETGSFYELLGSDFASMLLDRFSCHRPNSSNASNFDYQDEFTVTERRPLLLSDELVYCPDLDALWHAVYREALRKSKASQMATTERHDYVQQRTEETLTQLFGEQSVTRTVWIGTKGNHEEKDLLVLWGDAVVAVECKAPAAYPVTSLDTQQNESQLQQHADASQSANKGLQQAFRHIAAFDKNEALSVRIGGKRFTDGRRSTICTIPYRRRFAIVVTLEDYGPLLMEMPRIRSLEGTSAVAWGISLHDFEQFVRVLKIRGWGAPAFLAYLREREAVDVAAITFDELDFAAYFLKNGHLHGLRPDPATGVLPNYAELFDKMWLHEMKCGDAVVFPEISEPT